MSRTLDALKKLQQEGAFANDSRAGHSSSPPPSDGADGEQSVGDKKEIVPAPDDFDELTQAGSSDSVDLHCNAPPVTDDLKASDPPSELLPVTIPSNKTSPNEPLTPASDETDPGSVQPDVEPGAPAEEFRIELNESSPVLEQHLDELAQLEKMAATLPTDQPQESPSITIDLGEPNVPVDDDDLLYRMIDDEWDALSALADAKSLEAEFREILSADAPTLEPTDAGPAQVETQTTPTEPNQDNSETEPPPVELTSCASADETAYCDEEPADHDNPTSPEEADKSVDFPSQSWRGSLGEVEYEAWTPPELSDADAIPDEDLALNVESSNDYAPVIPVVDDLMDFEEGPSDLGESSPPGDAGPGVDHVEDCSESPDLEPFDSEPCPRPSAQDPVSEQHVVPLDDVPLDDIQTLPLYLSANGQMIPARDLNKAADTTLGIVLAADESPQDAKIDSSGRPTELVKSTHDSPPSFETQVAAMFSSSARQAEVAEFLARIQIDDQGVALRSLLFASVATGPHTAESLSLLAVARSLQKERILLVDADLMEQTLTRKYSVLEAAGLCDALAQSVDGAEYIRETKTPGVWLVPCGDDLLGISRDPKQIPERKLVQLIRDWEDDFDRVLIDAGSTDSTLLEVLGRSTQGAILLVNSPQVDPSSLKVAAERLKSSATNPLGCLLSGFPPATLPAVNTPGTQGQSP